MENESVSPNIVALQRVIAGFVLAVTSIVSTMGQRELTRRLLWISLVIISSSVFTFIVGKLALLPVQFVLATSRYLSPRIVGASIESMEGYLDVALHSLTLSLPQTTLFFLRYLYPIPMDRLFFQSLQCVPIDQFRDPKQKLVMEALLAKPGILYQTYFQSISAYLKRTFRVLILQILIVLVGFVPFIGRLAPMLLEVWYLQRFIGLETSLVISVGSHFGAFRFTPALLLSHLLSIRALARELLSPYFLRLDVSGSSQKALLDRNFTFLFGFLMPFYAMSKISYLGPLLFGLGQSAIVWSLVEIV